MAETKTDFTEKCGVGNSNKYLLMIGDSLTNWGGYGSKGGEFLEVVHDKTGVLTANEGQTGAWWQSVRRAGKV